MKLWPFSLSFWRRRTESAAKIIHETRNKKGSHRNTLNVPEILRFVTNRRVATAFKEIDGVLRKIRPAPPDRHRNEE